MNIAEFKSRIETKPVEGENKTYLYVEYRGHKYGQSYQNQVTSIEDMRNSFVVFYYPLYLKDFNLRLIKISDDSIDSINAMLDDEWSCREDKEEQKELVKIMGELDSIQ